jgi:uncharacterized membrane-anchored protein YitT (DUF2179 family)
MLSFAMLLLKMIPLLFLINLGFGIFEFGFKAFFQSNKK